MQITGYLVLFPLFVTLFCSNTCSAQWHLPAEGCSIRYDYDEAGNRTSRYWYCWTDVIVDKSAEKPPIAQPLANVSLKVLPNPTSNEATLLFSGPLSDVQYQVYDSKGTLVLEGAVNGDRAPINVQTLVRGLYHVQVSLGTELLITGLVVE